MKNITIYMFVLCLFICTLQKAGAQNRSEKRGVSYNIQYEEDLQALSPGVSWFYNWGVAPTTSVESIYENYDMDFIPMAWNNGYNRTALRAFLTAHPNVKYILGFNEPNFTAQANMTPAAAAAAWPELESIADEFGLKIVGPAVNFAPANGAVIDNGITYTDPWKYLDDFFAACPTCRIDYIAAHCYMNDPGSLDWYVNQFVSKYNKPVWLTEFCAWEYNAPLTTNATTGYEYQRSTMIRKIELLEKNPMVFRYAWFIPRSGANGSFPYMQFLKNVRVNPTVNPGELIELGKIYVNMSTFDTAHYYGVTEKIPAKDYIGSFWAKLEASTDTTSSIPIQLCNFENALYVEYLINIPTAGEYPLNLRMASTSTTVNPKFKIYSNGTLLKEDTVPTTGGGTNWETKVINVTLPAGKQTIKISSWDASGCKIQWLRFSSDTIIIEPEEKPTIVYVDENKNLQIAGTKKALKSTIVNISGKIVSQTKTTQKINVSHLSDGVYIITVVFEDKTEKSYKFIMNN